MILLTYLLLWLPPIQQKIKDIALTEVMKITGNKMKIGKLSLRPFNKLKLENVYLEDLNGDTLLYAGQLTSGFDLMQIFKDTLLIKSVQLDDFVIHVAKDSTSAPFNFQFLIDAFASKDTVTNKKPSTLGIEINDILLSNGTLSYNIRSAEHLPSGVFDSNHILIENLKTHLQLKSIDMERLNVKVESFAFKEKNGFELRNLKAELRSTKKVLQMKDLEIQLPSSNISFSDLRLDYTGMELSEIANGASYALNSNSNYIWPSDLKAFYPPLGNIADSLYFKGKLEGKFPAIDLTELQAKLGTNISLDVSARLNDFNKWAESPFEMTIHRLAFNEKGINTIENLSATKVPPQSKNQFLSDPVELSGKISGSLPRLTVMLNASSKTAALEVKGDVGYHLSSGAIHCDLNLNVDRFKFNSYVYKDITAHAVYINDSINLNLTSKDANVPLQINASGNLNPAKETIHLTAKINHLRLDTTNWLSGYPGADLQTNLSVNIKGFNPEKMHASIILDSLTFKTDKNRFEDRQLKMDYSAEANNLKNISIQSDVLTADLSGNFTLNTIATSFQQTLSEYMPHIFPAEKKKIFTNDQLTFTLNLKNSEMLSKIIDLPFSISEPTTLQGSYQSSNNLLALKANVPKIQINEMLLSGTFLDLQTDTIRKKINATAGTNRIVDKSDSMLVRLKAETIEKGLTLDANITNRSPQMNMDGAISTDIHLFTDKNSEISEIAVAFKPGSIKVNDQSFSLTPANVSLFLKEKKYVIENFALTHTESEYLKINGTISENPADTLKLDVSRLQLKTLTDIVKFNMNIGGEANGEIIVNRLLSTPLIITNDFSIKDITMEDKKIGTLDLKSAWSKELDGVMLDAKLIREGFPNSTISGSLLPHKDSLNINIDIQAIPLDWISPFTTGTLFGLSGDLGMRIHATGKLASPNLNGIVYMKDANIGLSITQAQYKISDTLQVSHDRFMLNNFRITDQNNQSALLNGNITHKNFASFNPDLTLNLDNFLVVNNANQIDSLFYGTLRISGQVKATLSDKNILLNATLTNSDNSSIMINLPESATEAQRYSSITFINTGEDTVKHTTKHSSTSETSLPIKLKMTLTATPGLKLGAVINPSTRDIASVTGSGSIDFAYNMNNGDMNLLGVYTVKGGQCTLSLKNITKKVFSIREGGTLTFKGDPMATAFDITAVYSTRADMVSLDKNFENIMPTTKIPVNALLTASGDLNTIKLNYDFEFPNERDEIKRKADGLMYTDDIKIKEIAYLLAFNTFYPINSSESKNTGTNIWTSLASSSLTNQLNNLLSGVLSENWSIGTELHSNDSNLSDMEMDVNVSTRLFNDRMTVNSNLGYRNAPSNSSNNFTGDFDVQLKLNKTGSFILKVYNVTNNNYYDKAKTTQGVGVVYQREARTFKKLFQKIKQIVKK